MAFLDWDEDELHVHYLLPRGDLPTRSFGLTLPYLGGAEAPLELIAERTPRGRWRPLFVQLRAGDHGRSLLPATDREAVRRISVHHLARDLMRLRWHVFPRTQRGRVVPPVVASWEAGDLTVARPLDPSTAACCGRGTTCRA
jgi:hypothetical protein